MSTFDVTDEMLTAAMRAFEPMSSVLRYREKDKWHSCDLMAMREAIRAVAPLILAAEPLRLTIEAPVCSATMAKLRAAIAAAPPGRLELLVESRNNSRTPLDLDPKFFFDLKNSERD